MSGRELQINLGGDDMSGNGLEKQTSSCSFNLVLSHSFDLLHVVHTARVCISKPRDEVILMQENPNWPLLQLDLVAEFGPCRRLILLCYTMCSARTSPVFINI
jgi:hypothetical protein